MKKLFLSMMLMAAGVLGWAQNANNDAFKSIDVDEFQKTLENCANDCVLVDVRTPEEYNAEQKDHHGILPHRPS